jgi:hypothetical protein
MLDKAITHGKEKRKPYRGAKAVDCTCRNHGSCPWCRDTRTAKNRDRGKAAKEKIEEE